MPFVIIMCDCPMAGLMFHPLGRVALVSDGMLQGVCWSLTHSLSLIHCSGRQGRAD